MIFLLQGINDFEKIRKVLKTIGVDTYDDFIVDENIELTFNDFYKLMEPTIQTKSSNFDSGSPYPDDDC